MCQSSQKGEVEIAMAMALKHCVRRSGYRESNYHTLYNCDIE